jgi:hypothetical protein
MENRSNANAGQFGQKKVAQLVNKDEQTEKEKNGMM